MNAYRIDAIGEITNYQESPEGFLTLFMTFSKVGPLEYRRADGTVEIEHVTEETLFDEESLTTAAHKPICYLHPPERVTAHNFWKFARGATGSKIIRDEPYATIIGTIHDATLVDIVKSNKARQISAGYTVQTVRKADGKLYQQNRVYNHFSVVPSGRAGSDVRVHLDSPDSDLNVGASDDRVIMTPVRCDGPFTHLQQQHTDSIPKWQRPLSLSRQTAPEQLLGVPKHQQPLRLTKKSVGRVVDKIGGGQFDHLKRQP